MADAGGFAHINGVFVLSVFNSLPVLCKINGLLATSAFVLSDDGVSMLPVHNRSKALGEDVYLMGFNLSHRPHWFKLVTLSSAIFTFYVGYGYVQKRYMTGLIMFTLADVRVSPMFELRGYLMISGALLADAVIGNIQEKSMKKYGGSSNEVVLYSYSIGSLYIFVYTIISGEFFHAFLFFLENPWETYGYATIFGILGYIGVNIVLTLIRVRTREKVNFMNANKHDFSKNRTRWNATLSNIIGNYCRSGRKYKDDLLMI
uniref:Adenosine 3'-phospho 5'-phosphosulfate transporter 2 n=1 Tax=Heterorhabditis bacteriophora TaxID=37862 RepID=A0A1I7X6Y5_HETBA